MEYQVPSYVYFLQSQVDDRRIKIGYTINLSYRFLSNRNEYGLPIKLLGVIEGGREIEQELHNRFAAYRIQGKYTKPIEWFEPAPELLTYIRENTYMPKSHQRGLRRFCVDHERAIELECLAYDLGMTVEDLLAEAIDAVLLKYQKQLPLFELKG